MKPKVELRDGNQLAESENMELSTQPATLCHKYNLRSKGPARYVQFCDAECPICLEEFRVPVIANCGHSFCKTCIEMCMKKGSPAVCPICKNRLIKRLFLFDLQYLKNVDESNAGCRNI